MLAKSVCGDTCTGCCGSGSQMVLALPVHVRLCKHTSCWRLAEGKILGGVMHTCNSTGHCTCATPQPRTQIACPTIEAVQAYAYLHQEPAVHTKCLLDRPGAKTVSSSGLVHHKVLSVLPTACSPLLLSSASCSTYCHNIISRNCLATSAQQASMLGCPNALHDGPWTAGL